MKLSYNAAANNAQQVNSVDSSVDEKARSLMVEHQHTAKNRQQAMLSRVASQVGLTM